MSLRRKLTLRSSLLFTVIMLLVMAASYLLFRYSVEQSYKQKLLGIALLSAHFYLEKDEMNADIHKNIERQFKKISKESIRLYRANSTVYVDDSVSFEPSGEIIQQTIREGNVSFKVGERYFHSMFYKDNEGDFVIMVSGINVEGDKQLYILFRMLLFTGLAGGFIHFVLASLLATRTFRPFDKLIGQVRAIRGHDGHSRLNYKADSGDEIAGLINEFNYLLDRLDSGFKIQRNFLRNASHEIKTPLAIIIGDIEVALNAKRNVEEYERVLNALRQNSLHLRSIIDSLTALSNLEAESADHTTMFRVDEIVWEVVEKKMLEYPGRKVQVEFVGGMESNEGLLTVSGNRELIFMALGNIVDNAIKYSEEVVHIRINTMTTVLTLDVEDAGPGIRKEDMNAIFDMFYRSPASAHIPGHGIGLYLTKLILSKNNIGIQVISDGGTGTTFRLKFGASGK